MSVGLRIAAITVSDGTFLDLSQHKVVVFVGPNNAGKSRLLREVHGHLNSGPHPHLPFLVATGVECAKGGDGNALLNWLGGRAHRRDRDGVPHWQASSTGWQREDQLRSSWEGGPPFHALTPFLVLHAGADGRLGLAGSTGSFDFLSEAPANPLQVLALDPKREEELAAAARAAFGQRITVTRVTGAQIHLLYGETLSEPEMPPTAEHLEELRALPALSEQGDGVRSFVGLLLALVSHQIPILLVDEPEAFLHPPQARLLGAELARRAEGGVQMLIATHSSDVLNGLLDLAERQEVGIVRLTRADETNHARMLEPTQVLQVARDPLLRYSGLLDGLFHGGVVVCEGDSDCLFYSAVRDQLHEGDASARDLLFIQCGGKQRIPPTVSAARKLGIPVAVVADFDLLRDQQLLKDVVRACELEWSGLETLGRRFAAAIDVLKEAPKTSETRDAIDEALSHASDEIDNATAKAIRDAVRVRSGWDRVKESGVHAIPPGDPAVLGRELLEKLATGGVFVVPEGELEGWIRVIGGKGPAWVSRVLELGHHKKPSAELEDFVRRIVTFFGLPG